MVTGTELPELLTVKQTAKELNMSKCSVYRWVKRKWLMSMRMPNGTIRILRSSVDTVLAGK